MIALSRIFGKRAGLSLPAYGAFAAVDKAWCMSLLEGSEVKRIKATDDFYLVGLCDSTGEVEGRDTQIRGLPSERILGVVTEEQPEFAGAVLKTPRRLSSFRANERFVKALQEVVWANMQQSLAVREECKSAEGGWLLLRDYRAPVTPGRAPEPTEFFGAALIENRLPMPSTYQPNEFYQVLSPLYGYPRMGPSFLKAFLQAYPTLPKD